jgi:C-terminal processing protease CtpA/Prc
MARVLKTVFKALALLLLLALTCSLYTAAFLVMESSHYLGRIFPYWILLLLPAFLIGRLSRRLRMALLLGGAIPICISLAAYLYFFVRSSGALRLAGWFVDLWPWVLILVILIVCSIVLGHWLSGKSKKVRRWLTAAVCSMTLVFSILQVFLLLSSFIQVVFFRLDLRTLPRDQAIVAMGDFFRKHYNYLEYKGIDWDGAVSRAVSLCTDSKNDGEYQQIVTELINTLGDGHLRVQKPVADGPEPSDIDLGVRWVKLENRWFVMDVMDDSPACRAGWQRGMELLEAAGHRPSDLIRSAPDWRFNSRLGTIRGNRSGERARLSFMLRRPERTAESFLLGDPSGAHRAVELRYEKWDWPRLPYFEKRKLPCNIGYLRIGRFVSNYFPLVHSVDRALEEFWNTRGLVIDVRKNPGGIAFITDSILGRFCSERLYYGRLQCSPDRYAKLHIMPRRPLYKKPVAVLIDENAYSASELFAYAASAVPGITLIGRPTGGVVSCPSQQRILLPAGMSMEFTFGALTDPKGSLVVEWTGVAPDVFVPLTMEDLRHGVDRDLETAVRMIAGDGSAL